MPFSQASTSDHVTLLPSTAVSGAGTVTGSAYSVPGCRSAVAFSLDVTAAATGGTDTLDVTVQGQVSGTWIDVCHFTQVAGSDSVPETYTAKIAGGAAEAIYKSSTSLSAGSVKNILCDYYRVKYTTVDAGGAAFTFSVTAQPM